MEGSEHLRKTLEHYRQQRQQKLAEFQAQIQPLELMIRQLERDLGEPSSLEAAGTSDNPSIPNPPWVHVNTGGAIRPDEFYSMSQSDAAKAYLRKVGHAVTLDELVEALQKGGAKVGGAEPKRTLYVSLARNPRKEFVWPSKDHVGLKEFYDRKN
jgi:hypothetical protein